MEEEEGERDEDCECLLLNDALRELWFGVEEIEEYARRDRHGLDRFMLQSPGETGEDLAEGAVRSGRVAGDVMA